MKTAPHVALALALAVTVAATGCADAVDDNAPPATTPDDGEPIPENDAIDATGTYAVRSSFDVATNMPGKVGEAVNLVIAATDNPDDPAAWILEQAVAAMPNGLLKSALNQIRGFVAGFINDRILQVAPNFVAVMTQVGNDLGQVAKRFELNETLEVTGATATHTVTGLHLKIDNVERDFAFADYQIPNIVVPNIGVTFDDTGTLELAPHRVPLAYGKVLRIALDELIIPTIDPTANDLHELFAHEIDCAAVGQQIASALALGFGADTFAAGCRAGVTASANLIYAKIAEIDGSALEFELTGTAKALDSDGDGKVDRIQSGTWTGTTSYAGTPAPLATATFHGERQ